MALGDGGYLPPVVASLQATNRDFVATIIESKAILSDFAKTDTQTQIGANVLPLETTLTSVKMQLLNFTKDIFRARLGADSAPFLTDVAALRAEVMAMSPMDIRIDAEIGGALAKLAELRGALAMAQMGSMLGDVGALTGAGGGGRGGIGGLVAGLLGGMAAGGGGGGNGGLLGALGWKGLPTLPLIGGLGMAGFATPIGLAGFSAEHVLTTLGGLLGSAGGAAMGGGLLALGNAGISGVGMGSDSAVMRSTIADTRQLGQEYDRLQRAIAIYGANSIQARAAQYDFNQTMQQFTPAAAQAQLALAQSAQSVNAFWDQASSGARIQATNIMQQVLGLARTYIPLVTDAASRNLGIINTAIKPLLDYLQGPATNIFQHLEDLFAQRLPMSVDAFTQGIEILIRTIGYVADATGGFLPKLDQFLRYTNSDTGFIRWEHDIDVLIGMFHTWAGFIVDLGRVFVDTFKLSAGLGIGIIQTLDGMLVKLDAWIKSTDGQSKLKTLFEVHKDEVIALLKLLPQLTPLADVYLKLAPAMTEIVVGMAGFLDAVSKVPVAGPALDYGLALLIIVNRLGIIAGLTWVWDVMSSKAVVSAARVTAAWVTASARIVASWVIIEARATLTMSKILAESAINAVRVAAIWIASVGQMAASWVIVQVRATIAMGQILAVSALNAARTAAVWLVANARIVAGWIAQAAIAIARTAVIVAANVAGALATAAAWAAAWLVAFWPLALLVIAVAIAVALIVSHWTFFKNWFAEMWSLTVTLVQEVWAHIVLAAQQALGWVQSNWVMIVGYLTGPIGMAVAQIVTHFDTIKTTAENLVGQFVTIGQNIVSGMIRGITSMGGALAGAAQSLVNGLSSDVKKFLGIGSPSRLFAEQVGMPIAQGIAAGITQGHGVATASLVGLNSALLSTAHGLARPSIGGGLALAGAGGLGSTSISMPITVHVSGAASGSPQGIGNAVAQEVGKQLQAVVKSLNSGARMPGR